MPAPSLFEAFQRVPDFRSALGKRHQLQSILALAVCAMLCGCKSLYALAQFGRDHADDLADWLGFQHRKTPCVATFHRVFRRLDVVRFETVLQQWLTECLAQVPAAPPREAVAIDGKTLCGSQGHQLPAVHLVAAFRHRLGLPLAQAAVDPSTNEAKAVLPLLRALVREGRVITGDAMFCQREICAQVVEQGGDYVLMVKENQPSLQEAIATALPDAPPSRSSRRQRSTRMAVGSSGGG
jgi:hypothetical protein